MDDSRSIDFAKTASIDMMALNNKVVNMRQTVKRTKVHVINKLTKNITKLKKKKGSDEQRQQNLQKAERLIEEIDSVKKLKPDKVSKYALANTMSFAEVSKRSISPGPRALARLADHPLLAQAVSDFRKQHSDWKDLAAYLLIKQTGRRFKTKKQKETKSHSVENINASETMTKAYIQSRFGQEGLKKAEQNFERKRRRSKFKASSEADGIEGEGVASSTKRMRENEEGNNDGNEGKDNDGVNSGSLQSRKIVDKEKAAIELGGTVCENGDVAKSESEDEDTGNHSMSVMQSSNTQTKKAKIENKTITTKSNVIEKNDSTNSDSEEEDEDGGNDNEMQNSRNAVEERSADFNSSDSSEEEDSSDVEENSEQESEIPSLKSSLPAENDSKQTDTKQEKSASEILPGNEKHVSKHRECVVKELNLEKNNFEGSDSSDSDDSNGSDDDDGEEENASDSDDKERNIPRKNSAESKKSRNKMKEKRIPEFLLKEGPSEAQEAINDPFFAGSDEDDDFSGQAVDSDPEVQDLVNDEDFGADGLRSNKTKSLFYNPYSNEQDRPSFKRYERSTGGRGFGGRGRGSDHRGQGRGWRGRGDFRGRGGLRGRGERQGQGERSWSRDRDQSERSHWSASRGRHGHQTQDRPNRGGFSKGAPERDSALDDKPKEKLHPSWEASKKRKEQSGIQAFAGKKITFDDD